MIEERMLTAVPPGAFAPVAQLEEEELVNARTRAFMGNGSEFLPVPGLLKLESVRMKDFKFDTIRTDAVLLDTTGQQFGYIQMPMVDVAKGLDGVPILRRNTCSNDGVWQDGEVFFVTAEWDAAVVPEVIDHKQQVAIGEPTPSGGRRGRK